MSTGSFSRNAANDAPHEASRSKHASADVTDIGVFVERHRRLVELFFPFKVAWDITLHVARWENYLLTVSVCLALCVLMYYPSLFLSCLTLLSIILMAIGKYYGQTKNLSILKTRESPNIDKLDQDLQALQRFHKEQNTSHSILIEYKQIIQTIERYFLLISKFVDYLYRIILWKSPEVSLCVTVLLCICFVLLCTMHLRVIASCVPILILCSNRHFLKKTVELWKKGGAFIFMLVKLKTTPPQRSSFHQNAVNSRRTSDNELTVNSIETNEPLEELRDSEERSRSHTQSQENMESGGVASSISNSDGDVSSGATSLTTVRDSPRTTNMPAKDLCARCNTSFSNLLKRRHKCTHCGVTFCGSCTVKVKRAFLGATSPAAFEESVRVCVDCKALLERLNISRLRTTSLRT